MSGFANRISGLLSALNHHGFDAALIHRPENMRYLTGSTAEGCVFVCADETVVVTDFRYTEQVSRQAPQARCVMTSAQLREKQAVKALTDAHGVRRLAVETDFLTHDDFEALRSVLDGVELGSVNGAPENLRTVKDAGEIECMRRAGEIASRAFDHLLGKIHVGMTEKQVQILLDYEMLNLGSEGNAFATISAAGANGSLPHAIPSDYAIREGDLLTLDFGAKFGGYCSDVTRTVGFGKVSAELRAIYDLVYDAHMAALEAVKPGAVCGDLDKIARDMIDARYPGAFGHSLGHGVGLFIHEQPRVAKGSETVLESGFAITIEPGVYIPGLGGCRIEDTAILTDDGFIDIISSPKQFIAL